MTQSGVTVELADPRAAKHLLEASHALMQSLFPEETNNYLSIEALSAPDVSFFAAEVSGQLVGCGALVAKDGYGEIKSMFVDPDARGKGIAALVLGRLLDEAHSLGMVEVKLETGTLLNSAHRLYERHGFTVCEAFGNYEPSPYNVFMEKRLG